MKRTEKPQNHRPLTDVIALKEPLIIYPQIPQKHLNIENQEKGGRERERETERERERDLTGRHTETERRLPLQQVKEQTGSVSQYKYAEAAHGFYSTTIGEFPERDQIMTWVFPESYQNVR